ncbi:MAG: hypothetical protein K0S80_1957 [Neobacillus sp.]|nr:hypothetical protein [Neobacillus sp.]
MYLMTWRDYDPTISRFIVPDTDAGQDDEPLSKNKYLYAEGDPVNNVDPTGNYVETAWDILCLSYSINAFIVNPNFINGLSVLLDGISVLLPGVPGGAGAVLKEMVKLDKKGRKYLTTIFGSGKAYKSAVSFIKKHEERLLENANKIKKGKTVFHKHHIYPQEFRKWFKKMGIDIDDYTIKLDTTTHLKGVHGNGLDIMEGKWNKKWREFRERNSDASKSEAKKFAKKLLKEYGLDDLPIKPYK